MVLVGQVQRELVGLVNEHGPLAVGLSGEDAGLFTAERTNTVVDGEEVDLGLVGEVASVRPEAVLDLVDAGRIPVIVGGSGDDAIFGGRGSDALNGRGGADELTGGRGADTFVFDRAPDPDTVDTIFDFTPGTDKIELRSAIFAAAGPIGALDVEAFHAGAVALEADDRLLYDAGTGNLAYDEDGTGVIAPIAFARLDAGLAVTAGDFLVA